MAEAVAQIRIPRDGPNPVAGLRPRRDHLLLPRVPGRSPARALQLQDIVLPGHRTALTVTLVWRSTATPMRHSAVGQSCRVSKTIGWPAFSPTGGCATSPSSSTTTWPSYCRGETTRWGGDAVTPYEANRPVVIAGVGDPSRRLSLRRRRRRGHTRRRRARGTMRRHQVAVEDAESVAAIKGETPTTLGRSEN